MGEQDAAPSAQAAPPITAQLLVHSDRVTLQLSVRDGPYRQEASSSDEEEDVAEAAQMAALLEQMTAAGSDTELADATGIDEEVAPRLQSAPSYTCLVVLPLGRAFHAAPSQFAVF